MMSFENCQHDSRQEHPACSAQKGSLVLVIREEHVVQGGRAGEEAALLHKNGQVGECGEFVSLAATPLYSDRCR